MFDGDCLSHRSRVLLGARAIRQLRNTAGGVVVHWRCFCGAANVERFGHDTTEDTTATGVAAPAAA
jgi:hypothetical protein